MIDYEKLQEAAEIAIKDDRYYFTIGFGAYSKGSERLEITAFDSHTAEEFYFDDIEGLLQKLKELTTPKPRYKVGQSLWYLDSQNIMSHLTVTKFYYCDEEDTYCYDNGVEWDSCAFQESYLFPSRESLVEHQIQYWQSLKEQESCQHEGDGTIWRLTTLEDGQGKCIKCGEFY